MKMQHRWLCILVTTTAWTWLFGCRPVAANPSHQEPARPLAAHGTIEGARELVEQLYAIYDDELQFVNETHARRDDPTRFSDRRISTSAGRLWKAQRDAKHLQLMGEPAGYDLEKRLRLLATQVYNFGQTYRGTPRGQQLIRRILTKLQRERPSMQRFLQQADSALAQGKLEVFEQVMEKKGQDLVEQTVFLTPAAARPHNEAFNAMLARGDSRLVKKRQSDYADQAAVRIDQQLTLAGEFADEAQRVIAAIAQDGVAQLADVGSAGPVESMTYLGSRWGAANAAVLRANGLKWAFPAAQPTQSFEPRELKETALSQLALLIESAAKSTPPDRVAEVYAGMLDAISMLDRRVGVISEDVINACREPLEQLVAKDPGLASRIDAYHRATDEVLRWRQAYASQQATHLGQGTPRANAALRRECDSEIEVRPPYAPRALVSVAAPPLFNVQADWMVQESADCLVGESIIEDRVARLSPNSGVAVVPLTQSHYGNVRVPLPSDAEVRDLLAALLVDEDHPALSPAAAGAVSAAKMQDYETVLARIEGVHLESIVTRLISLPDAAYPMVNLGASVALNETVPAIDHTLWRLDLQPLWARHRYFTIRLEDSPSSP